MIADRDMSVPTNMMIDPSLIVARRTGNDLLSRVVELSDAGFKVHISAAFRNLVQDPSLTLNDPTLKFFLGNAHPLDPMDLKDFMSLSSTYVSDYTLPAAVEPKYQSFLSRLSDQIPMGRGVPWTNVLRDILAEEWIFLNESSWIVARTRKTFDRFVEAGSATVLFGKKTSQWLIRSQLKKTSKDPITKLDILRTLGKWVAVAAKDLDPQFNPVASKIGNLIIDYFVLFDP